MQISLLNLSLHFQVSFHQDEMIDQKDQKLPRLVHYIM